MTPAERRQVAGTLREWASWCEVNAGDGWQQAYIHTPSREHDFEAQFPAQDWCWGCYGGQWHEGPDAALALCFAAAMVESGDGA